MKKILTILTVIVLIALVFNFNIVGATDQTPEATVNLTATAAQSENQVIFTINLGDFVNVEEDSVMSAVVTLDFDQNQIESIKGTAYEGWNVTVSAETKTVLFETDTATPNVKMGEIIFNLDPSSVTEETTGTVALSEINISDGINLDETYERTEFTYTLEPGAQENPDDNSNTIIDGNIIIDTDPDGSGTVANEITPDGTNNVKDNTIITDNKLPQTGISIAITLGIVAIVILAIIGIVRYKSIKIK